MLHFIGWRIKCRIFSKNFDEEFSMNRKIRGKWAIAYCCSWEECMNIMPDECIAQFVYAE